MAARCYTGNTEIVALRHSYHGRSAMAMSLTGQGAWRLGPSQAGIVHAHNAYCYRCPFGLTYPSCEVRCAQDMEELIRSTTGGQIAGFIAEPIQGVGGFITPPKEYFQIVEKIVRAMAASSSATRCNRMGLHRRQWLALSSGAWCRTLLPPPRARQWRPIGLTVAGQGG
jgi:4-aminobutyrate aminotransferase-like enzyme